MCVKKRFMCFIVLYGPCSRNLVVVYSSLFNASVAAFQFVLRSILSIVSVPGIYLVTISPVTFVILSFNHNVLSTNVRHLNDSFLYITVLCVTDIIC